jgi:hypothetical protein
MSVGSGGTKEVLDVLEQVSTVVVTKGFPVE